MIYCDSESSRFPESEFRHEKDGKIVRPYIHETDSPHYADGGKPVKPTPPPPMPAMPAEKPPHPPSLYLQLKKNVLTLEQKALKLQAEIEDLAGSGFFTNNKGAQLIRNTKELTQIAKKIAHLVDRIREEN